jgi:ectoine hydroxylase-related dioxygenase (phytanoyl-CoA dioxygenase family)
MIIPTEFTPQAVAAASASAVAPYQAFHTSGEPDRSLVRNNPWLRVPAPTDALAWGKGAYYDTTVARKHPHWRNAALPRATKDIAQLRRDFYEWGYCLIEDGVSAQQCARLQARVADQAAAERALGIAHLSPAQQHVWALVNKGVDFVACMTHEPQAVQAGPLIEQLLDETVGAGWNHLSFISNISYPNCHPQGLHQDQSLLAPYHFAGAPVLVNTVYILQDVNEVNGGTLIIPGSHKAQDPQHGTFGVVPPAINLEAAAGTIMLMDGRVLHGGAVNRSAALRYILTNSVVRPWVRQQENFLLTIRPEILESASDKFLWRAGFQATATRNMVEGYGYFGSGRQGDPNGALVHVRHAMDHGGYRHIGELSLGDVEAVDLNQFTQTRIQQRETVRSDGYRRRLQAISPS